MIEQIKNLFDTASANAGFRRYFANTSWMFGEQILRMISGLFVGVWVARYLGPEQFGLFSYAIAFVSIFSSIAKLGLDSILVRDLISEPERRDVFLGTAFWLKVIGALVVLAIILLTLLFANNDYRTNLYIFIIASGIVFQSFEVIDFYFQSKVLSKFVSICRVNQLIFSSILKVYFVLTGSDLFWFVIVSLVDQFLLAISLFVAYRLHNSNGFYKYFDIDIAKSFLKSSWPIILSGLTVTIYMRIDQIMLKEMLGAREVGIYTAAVRLSEFWYFIPVLITNSLFPSILNAKKISKDLYFKRLQRLYTFMISIALIVAISMTTLSDELIKLLYGETFKEAAPVLAITIWGFIPVVIGVVWSSWLLAENRQHLAVISHVSGAILNFLLNIYLIPKYGICGCAVATLISYFLSAALALSLYRGKFTFSLILHIYKHG